MKKILYNKKMPAVFLAAVFLFLAACSGADPEEKTAVSESVIQGQDTEGKNNGWTNHPQSVQTDSGEQSEDNSKESLLQVHYLDVGQGDAVMIVCDGEYMLIDAGNNDQGTAVWSYLLHQGAETLKYVIGTHPDADHVGGLDVIITKFDCGTVFLPEAKKDTRTYEDVLSALAYKNYKKTVPVCGDTYRLGSAEFTITGPSEQSDDANDNSIALVLTHGANRFYFEGDASEKEEQQILASGIDIAANVYMAGHHGSRTATSDELLDAVNPSWAVISAGEDNKYGHPHAEVLNKLRAKGISVYRTDEQGTVVAQSDGKEITFNCMASDSWKSGEPSGDTDTLYEGEDTSEEEADASSEGENTSEEGAETVQITKSGEKYHRAGCSYLKRGSTEISLEDAKNKGYTPCSRCNPPQ